jgi:hypothetical protein
MLIRLVMSPEMCKGPLDSILSALDGIIDDESAGVYEEYTEDEFYGEDEEF